jgi:hypothetical protein
MTANGRSRGNGGPESELRKEQPRRRRRSCTHACANEYADRRPAGSTTSHTISNTWCPHTWRHSRAAGEWQSCTTRTRNQVLLGNRWGHGRQRAGRPDRSQACDRTPRARRTGWGRQRSWTTRSRCCPVRAGGSGEQASHSLLRSGSTGNLTTMKITSLFLWTPALVWLPAQVLNAVDKRSGFPIRKFHRFHEGYS